MLRTDHGGDPDRDLAATARLAGLCRVFDLTVAESRLLRVVLAAEVDPNICLALAALQSGEPRPRISTALELAGVGLFAGGLVMLDAGAPLRQHRLVRMHGTDPLPMRWLSVPDRLTQHVLGSDALHPLTALMRTTAIPVATADSSWLARSLRRGHRFCYLRELPTSAAVGVAAGAYTELDLGYLVLDARQCPDGELADALDAAVLDAALTQLGLVIAGFDAVAAAGTAAVRRLTDSGTPVLACGSGRWNPSWTQALPPMVTVGPLRADHARRLWNIALGTDTPRGVFAAPVLRPEDIVRAANSAIDRARNEDHPVDDSTLAPAVAALAPVLDEQGVTRLTPRADRSDLALPDRTAQAVDELIDWVRHREQVLAGTRLAGKATKGSGLTALFTGGPGTGKTLAAEAIAHTLGLDLLTVDLPTIIDKYIGETEKNLERVFGIAERSPCVLFFDEADALFGSRSSVGDSRDRYANQEVAYLLQRMEQFSGVAILATNLRGNLDPAFTRRLHFVISFLDPDPPVKIMLWRSHLEAVQPWDPEDPVDLDALAQQVDLTGGGIRNVVLAAAFAAAIDETPCGMRHLRRAAIREFEKTGRRPPAWLGTPA